MDLKHVGRKKTASPSKFVAFVALFVAVSLPFFLVKTFRDKNQAAHFNKPLSTPVVQSASEDKGPLVISEDGASNRLDEVLAKKLEHVKANEKKESQHSHLSTVQETVSSAKTQIAKSMKKDNNWEIVVAKEGDTLASLFNKLGLDKKTLALILKDNPHAKTLANIKPGQKLQFSIHNKRLEKLLVPLTPMQSIIISRHGEQFETKVNSRNVSSHNHYVTATVKGSLYGTAKRHAIPYKLVQQMAQIFNWEIDFSKDVREGDRFTIVYKAFFIEGKRVGTGEIIAATYTTKRGKTFQAIRHTHENGKADYYNENGESLRKAFTRYPVKFSHISSTFSLNRMHPILKKRRPHKGVDLAAAIGTPIRAIGDGRITSIGMNNGYGNMIKIQHNNTYSTIYAHMLRFQKGLSKGSRVKRGQIIGYVGQSGLANGPHCHFEFHVHNQPKNPSTVDLPRASPVPKTDLASFKYNAGALLAHMKLFEEAHLASQDALA